MDGQRNTKNEFNNLFDKLNVYCIYEILKEIKIQCDSSKIPNRLDDLNYKDLINFAVAFECIRDSFEIWNPNFYYSLQIEETFLSESDEVIVDFERLHERLRESSKKDKERFWTMYTDALKSNRNLRSVEFMYWDIDTYCSEHKERFEQLLGALKNRSLRDLTIIMEGYSLSNFQELPNLTWLTLNVKFNADELVEYCKSNPNLLILHILSNEIYGNLTDIVPYCNNLKELSFKMKIYFNDSEYTALAKLPNLRKLQIFGEEEIDSMENDPIDDPPPFEYPLDYQLSQINELTTRKPENGSLTNLFRALALQEDSQLRVLVLEDFELYFEEISEIAKIKTLFELRCDLSDLNKDDSSMEYLKLIIERNIEAHINCFHNGIEIKSKWGKLDIEIRDSSCPADLTPLAYMPNLLYLHLSKFDKVDSLTLMKAPASKQSTMLQRLQLNNATYREVEQIAQIKSLRYIQIEFSDPQSIKLLAHLPKLKILKINSKHDFRDIAKYVVNVLMGAANEKSVILKDIIHITFNKILGKLTISKFSYSDPISAQQYAALAKIPHLNTLRIRGWHQKGSFQYLFQALAAKNCSDLQGIIVNNRININIEETKELAKILSLKRLQCGFSDKKVVELLAQLTNLEELEIFNHKRRCLKQFLQNLVSRESSYLKCLTIKGKKLTPEETALVAEVKSLRKLDCGFVNAQNVEKLAQLNQLEELFINHRDMVILQIFSRCQPLSYNETLAVVGLKSLRSLHCKFADIDSIKLLVQLPELEKLSILFTQPSDAEAESIKSLAKLNKLTHLEINSDHYCDLKKLFAEISSRSSPILQNLIINGFGISLEDIKEIIKINSLRGLKCTFRTGECCHYLTCLKNLEVLEIISFDRCGNLSQILLGIFQECRNLKAIDLYPPPILNLRFVNEALKILKAVRNPEEQGPLKLRLSTFEGFCPEHADEVYLKISDFACTNLYLTDNYKDLLSSF